MPDNTNSNTPSDAKWFDAYDPELFTHTLASIILKNTEVDQRHIKEGIVQWREQFFFGGGNLNLAEVLARDGRLERMRINTLLKATEYAIKRREDKIFGKRALKKGLISKTQLDEALAFQKQLFKALREVKRLETILVDDGFLKPDAAASIWADFARARPKKSVKPASLSRAAKSAGTALEIEDDDVIDDDDDDEGDVEFRPKTSGGGSALDLESLKADQAPTAVGTSAAAGGDDVLLDDSLDISDINPRPSRTEERDAWAAKKAEAEKQRHIEIMDDDDFSDDNMNAALDDAIDEIDLSDDFTSRSPADPNAINKLLTDADNNSNPTP